MILDLRSLVVDFNFCSFCWVKLEVNMEAHTLCQIGSSIRTPYCFFPKNLSSLIEEA